MGARNCRRVQAPILPEMDFSKVAETWIGKRSKERMTKINFPEHRVIAQMCLRKTNLFNLKHPSQRAGARFSFGCEENRLASCRFVAEGGCHVLGNRIGDHVQRSVFCLL